MIGLLNDPIAYFDMLSCVTGVDNGPEANTIELYTICIQFPSIII